MFDVYLLIRLNALPLADESGFQLLREHPTNALHKWRSLLAVCNLHSLGRIVLWKDWNFVVHILPGIPIPTVLLICLDTAAGGVTDSVGGPPGRLPEGVPIPIFDMGLLTGGGG